MMDGTASLLSLMLALVQLYLCVPNIVGAVTPGSSVLGPALLSSDSLAPRLAFQRQKLSERHLQRAQGEAGSDGGDLSLAWRHLEASYALDRGNAEARRQILAHHLDAALNYDSSTAAGQDWTWRVDHELDAALATVQHIGTPAELEEFNDLAQQFNYRKRRRQRVHAGEQRFRELWRQQQQPTDMMHSKWRTLFASMVMQRPIGGIVRPWSNGALVEAALAGLQLSQRPEGITRQVYAEGTPKATIANNEFFAWQMDILRNTSRCWSGFRELEGWASLETEMRIAAADFLVAHGMPEADAYRRSALAPLVTWASVHSAGSSHPAHIHADSTVSGVYYAQVPEGSGGIEFVDPRGATARTQGENGEAELPTPPFTHGMVVNVKEGELVVFPGYLPHSVELMVAPLEHGQHASSRVSISFNLLGGWEPPLTTLGHTWWSTTNPRPFDSQRQDQPPAAQDSHSFEYRKDNPCRAGYVRCAAQVLVEDGPFIPQLWRLALWSTCHYVLAWRGHGGLRFNGIFFVAAAIFLMLEHQGPALLTTIFSSTSNVRERQPPSSEYVHFGDASQVEMQSLPIDCQFGLLSGASNCPVKPSTFAGLTSTDLRDPDTLVTLAGSLKQQLLQHRNGNHADDVDSTESTGAVGFGTDMHGHRLSVLPLYLRMRIAAEVLRGGPSRSNWTELRDLGEDLSRVGEWAEAVPRWALAIKHRLGVAAGSAIDPEAGGDVVAAQDGHHADKRQEEKDNEHDVHDCIGQSRCYGRSVFLDIAAMRRQYAVALVHTGAQPDALVQGILAVRAEQMAVAAATGSEGKETADTVAVIADLTALPSNGWYDGQEILDAVQQSHDADRPVDAASATCSTTDSENCDVVYRTAEEHAALFPMGFVHDLVGRSGDRFGSSDAQSDGVLGPVRSSTVLPTQNMFTTVLAPGAASGTVLPGCHRAVRKLCRIDLAPVEEDGYARTKRAHTLLSCVQSQREALEAQCLFRGVGQPLLLRGAARRLPAYTRWRSDAALDRQYGGQVLHTVEQEKIARRSTPSISMTISDFLRRYDRNASGDGLYAITLLPAAMRADVGPIDRGGENGLLPDGSMSTGPRLWFSSGGTSSVLHKDMLDNMNCVIAGNKHVAIVHPRLNSAVEAEQWDRLEWLEAVVSEGDCLFIPGGWYHQVGTPHGRSIAVNTFFQRSDS